MDLFEAIKTRHMCRTFDTTKSVPEELVNQLIQAGKCAPSAGGLRDQHFYQMYEQDDKDLLRATAMDQEHVAEASHVIVIASDFQVVKKQYGRRGVELYAAQDCAAAAENILLAATALGLGACWIGAFEETEVQRILKLPKHIVPMVMIPVGYKKI